MRGPPARNQRRARTVFNEEALQFLEQAFKEEPYPNIELRESMARHLKVDEARIHVSQIMIPAYHAISLERHMYWLLPIVLLADLVPEQALAC